MAAMRPQVGISACLLGQMVRYNGSHKRDSFLVEVLGKHVAFVPVCPEVEAGMGTPREAVRLVRHGSDVRMVGTASAIDHTDRMAKFARRRARELRELDGYIFKKNSPSCGLERVAIYPIGKKVAPARNGRGMFAAAIAERMPALPLSEEGWLYDAHLRDSFLARVFLHHRFRTEVVAAPSRRALIEFHARNKLLYMAHSPAGYRELGKLVANIGSDLSGAIERYRDLAMRSVALRATPGKHANALLHIVGYFKKVLEPAEKQELLELVEEFRGGVSGLEVPLTLLRHHLKKHRQSAWLMQQTYFQPYPKGLVIGAA